MPALNAISAIGIFLLVPTFVFIFLKHETLLRSNEVQNGFLDFIGNDTFPTNNKRCVDYKYNDYMCCVSLLTSIAQWCPIIQFNHYCRPIDDNHKPGSFCLYLQLKGGWTIGNYVKCVAKECNKEETMYMSCLKYRFNDLIFYYCSKMETLLNETVSIISPFIPGNHSALTFSNNTIYYEGAKGNEKVPIDTDANELLDSVNNYNTIIIVLLCCSGFFLCIGFITKIMVDNKKALRQKTTYGTI
jgi:hypothetical protein